MVLDDQLDKPIQSTSALFLGQPINLLHVVTYGEDGLPTSDWIGADNGVLCSQIRAHIFRRSTWFAVKLKAILFGGGTEAWLRVGGC